MFDSGKTPGQFVRQASGFTLFELIVTLAVLGILVMGTIPLAQNAVKRQKEIQLRETLRLVRTAIDEWKRDTVGACPRGTMATTGNPTGPPRGAPGGYVQTDPRSRVVIDDCTIFDNQNLDRYPPTIENLVNGVKVRERGLGSAVTQGGLGLGNSNTQASDVNITEEVTKVYLRHMPVDPMTGESDWNFRSSYQPPDDDTWDRINVYDIRSSSKGTALDGTNYSDW